VQIQDGECVTGNPERNHHDMVHLTREEVHLYGKEISGFTFPSALSLKDTIKPPLPTSMALSIYMSGVLYV